MAATTATAPADQFAGRSHSELAAMCHMRSLVVGESDDAAALRRRLRDYQATRQQDGDRFAPRTPRADSDTAARMALIDAEVRDHFAIHAQPCAARDVARALMRNQQEVLLSMQRLGCRRLTGCLYGPPATTTTQEEPR